MLDATLSFGKPNKISPADLESPDDVTVNHVADKRKLCKPHGTHYAKEGGAGQFRKKRIEAKNNEQ